MKRSRPWQGPSGFTRAVGFLVVLIVLGLVWEQVYGPESDEVEPAPQVALPRQVQTATQAAAATQAAPEGAASPRGSAKASPPRTTGQAVRRGTVISVDAQNKSLTVKSEGEELVVRFSPATRVMDELGSHPDDPFRHNSLSVGAAIAFKVDGDTLIGVRLLGRNPRGDIRQGKIASIDFDNLRMTVTGTNGDIETVVTEQTNFFGARGKDAAERLRTLRAGTDVMFLVRPKDGKNYLLGVRMTSPPPGE